MTTFRLYFCIFFTLAVLTSIGHAAPPASLEGKFVTLNGNRLEFPDGTSGNDGPASVEYSYSVSDSASAQLTVNYSDGTRSRQITLNFAPDGSPAGYQEFDLILVGSPTPPILLSGAFEMGDLEVVPPPPSFDSSAPDSLVGFYVKAGVDRYEFLTSEKGRLFIPGDASYFSCLYEIVDEVTAKVTATFEDGATVEELILTFDADGAPVSFVSLSSEGEFEIGANLHLGDLLIAEGGGELLGGDSFNAVGSRQTAGKRLSSIETVSYSVLLQNDGDSDSFRLRGTKSRRDFGVAYYTAGDRGNITAGVVAGTYETGNLEHDGEVGIVMEVTPRKGNGAMVAGVSARSVSVEDAKDFVKSHTQIKVKQAGKGKAKGKGKAQGKGKKNRPKRKGKRS